MPDASNHVILWPCMHEAIAGKSDNDQGLALLKAIMTWRYALYAIMTIRNNNLGLLYVIMTWGYILYAIMTWGLYTVCNNNLGLYTVCNNDLGAIYCMQ